VRRRYKNSVNKIREFNGDVSRAQIPSTSMSTNTNTIPWIKTDLLISIDSEADLCEILYKIVATISE